MAKRLPRPADRSARVRCAIYTRKSTEEGLDQEFNSLDAQREACAAYILSQKHEGWTLLPDLYADGGFSGGNLERPGIRQLLADVKAGRVDVIVVYKVDRLTRALSDFAKIVEILDGHGASFVSVTQAFNTTTSMGRLTLNVLLSFAQFEREVTGERIRDKIAASKRKGMWMGGVVALGYDVYERKLVINEAEAATVRLIYERYLALRSMRDLATELLCRGIRSKRRTYADGRVVGDQHFTIGALAHLIKNPVYVGDVRHKDDIFSGEHPAIIPRDIWDRAQALIANNNVAYRSGVRAAHPSPLAGMICDGEGRAMTPTHGARANKRYRYYVTRPGVDGRAGGDAWRIPAGEIEMLVVARLSSWLRDRAAVSTVIAHDDSLAGTVERAMALGDQLSIMAPSDLREMLQRFAVGVHLHIGHIEISFDPRHITEIPTRMMDRITLVVPAAIVRRGKELRLAFPPTDQQAPIRCDPKLIELIAKAEQAYTLLVQHGPSIAPSQRPHLVRLARLKYLAPEIVVSILDGRQPASLTARHLLRLPTIPLAWKAQREQLGFG